MRLRAFCLVLLVVLGPSACQRESSPGPAGVVALVGERTITVADVEAEILQRAPGYRGQQYQPMDSRRALLDSMVRFELLAAEAERRGYAKDPAVQTAMRREMVAAMIRQEIDRRLPSADVTDGEIAQQYRRRAADLTVPEQVRVRHILVRDPRLATRIVALATRKEATSETFQQLVAEYSEDPVTRDRQGDLGTVTVKSTSVAPELRDAALALKEPGDVSPVIRTSRGYHVLRLDERRPAAAPPLASVRALLLDELRGARRAKQLEELTSAARRNTAVELHEEKLQEVRLPGPAGATRLY